MYTFFLNWMGIVRLGWYDDNNIPYVEEVKWSSWLNREYTVKNYTTQYCCGRIDVDGGDLIWSHEISVPVMTSESWKKLGDWLDTLELDYIPMGDGIFSLFEEQTGHKIEWWKK
jgi:hypothetical protein